MPKTKTSYYWLIFFGIFLALIGTSLISPISHTLNQARAQGPFGLGIPRIGSGTGGLVSSNATSDAGSIAGFVPNSTSAAALNSTSQTNSGSNCVINPHVLC